MWCLYFQPSVTVPIRFPYSGRRPILPVKPIPYKALSIDVSSTRVKTWAGTHLILTICSIQRPSAGLHHFPNSIL